MSPQLSGHLSFPLHHSSHPGVTGNQQVGVSSQFSQNKISAESCSYCFSSQMLLEEDLFSYLLNNSSIVIAHTSSAGSQGPVPPLSSGLWNSIFWETALTPHYYLSQEQGEHKFSHWRCVTQCKTNSEFTGLRNGCDSSHLHRNLPGQEEIFVPVPIPDCVCMLSNAWLMWNT